MAFRLQKISDHVCAGFLAPVPTASRSPMGAIGSKNPDDVVVVSALRTAIGRAKKGHFKDTMPDDLLKAVLEGVVKEAHIDPAVVGDVVVGNVQLGGSYAGPARMAQLRAGFPTSVPIHAVNRQCSSGLQAVAHVATAIKSGMIDVGIGCGVESMTQGGDIGGGTPPPLNLEGLMSNEMAKQCLHPMGTTAEIVAAKWGITREMQDAMGVESHKKALAAQQNGHFKSQIVPVPVEVDGQTKMIDTDDGPRATTLEGLGKLKTVFKKNGGTVTAGTASQVSDGAAAVLLMSRRKAEELGCKIIGVFRGAKVCGVDPEVMGIGPAVAIPLALEAAGLTMDQVDIFEINEAFAAQAVMCVKELGVPAEKLNPNGGAIALGHPLGTTGARQVATLMHELHRTGKKTGVVSMCIGTGMGMAAVFEAEN